MSRVRRPRARQAIEFLTKLQHHFKLVLASREVARLAPAKHIAVRLAALWRCQHPCTPGVGHSVVQRLGQRMDLGKRRRRHDDRLRKKLGDGAGKAGKLLVTACIVLVAVQLVEKKFRRACIARVVQQVGIGGLETTRLKTLDLGNRLGQRRIAGVLLAKLRHALQCILNGLCCRRHISCKFSQTL